MTPRTFVLQAAAFLAAGVGLGVLWTRPKVVPAPAYAPAVILSPHAQVAARNPAGATLRPLPPGAPKGPVLDQVQVKLAPLPESTAAREVFVSLVDTPEGPRAVVEDPEGRILETTHLAGPRLAPRLPRWSAGALKDTQRGLVGTVGRAWGPLELRVEGYKGGAAVGFVLRW